MMPKLFQMQVLSLESPLPLGSSGEPGDLYPDGGCLKGNGTSAGLKPSLLVAWFDTSWMAKCREKTSWYMGITKEWSRVGGMDGAATETSMTSSSS